QATASSVRTVDVRNTPHTSVPPGYPRGPAPSHRLPIGLPSLVEPEPAVVRRALALILQELQGPTLPAHRTREVARLRTGGRQRVQDGGILPPGQLAGPGGGRDRPRPIAIGRLGRGRPD